MESGEVHFLFFAYSYVVRSLRSETGLGLLSRKWDGMDGGSNRSEACCLFHLCGIIAAINFLVAVILNRPCSFHTMTEPQRRTRDPVSGRSTYQRVLQVNIAPLTKMLSTYYFLNKWLKCLGVSVSDFWSWGRGFDSRYFHNFKCGLGLERSPPSQIRTIV